MNAEEVVLALRAHYGDAYALIEQVGDSTGAYTRRHLDVVAMGLWPSRGMEVHGIEVKVSKYDLMKEIANPAKAEAVASYCDKFYIAAPAGMIDHEGFTSVVPGWGLLEVGEERGKRVVKVPIGAKPREVVTKLDRGFIAAVLRRVPAPSEAMKLAIQNTIRAELEEEYQRRLEAEVSRRVAAATRTLEAVARFKEVTGIDILEGNDFRYDGASPEKTAKAVAFLVNQQSGWQSFNGQLDQMVNSLRADGKRAGELADSLEELKGIAPVVG